MKKLTPIKAIRKYCLDCSAGSAHEVKRCPITDCPLYPYKLGKNPYWSKVRTPKQQEAARKGGEVLKKSAKTPILQEN